MRKKYENSTEGQRPKSNDIISSLLPFTEHVFVPSYINFLSLIFHFFCSHTQTPHGTYGQTKTLSLLRSADNMTSATAELNTCASENFLDAHR